MKRDFLSKFYMLGRRLAQVACTFVFLCLVASPVYAHKVNIFAYVDGDLIKTESRFKWGRSARNSPITVQSH
jgi:hypothetical protein